MEAELGFTYGATLRYILRQETSVLTESIARHIGGARNDGIKILAIVDPLLCLGGSFVVSYADDTTLPTTGPSTDAR